jgi:hypothetical protein
MKITMCFGSQIFGCGKIYHSDSIIILISCKLSFPVVGLKIYSVPTLALKSRNKIFVYYLGNILNTRSGSS